MPKPEAGTVVRELFDRVWNGGDLQAAARLLAPDFVRYAQPTSPGQTGVAAFVAGVTLIRTAFPDIRFEIDDLMVAGDRVAVRWTAHATQRGEYRGVQPTGRRVRVSGIQIDRVVDGRIAAAWVCWDRLGLLEQLGAVAPYP